MKIIWNDEKSRALLLIVTCFSLSVSAQEEAADKLTLSGSIQSEWLIPKEDDKIGTGSYTDDALTNTYVDLVLRSKHVEAGARLEYLEHPMPGFENDFKGWGVPHFYLKGGNEKAEVTLGTFYEQFGSGFVLRSYEERSLGVDNSLLGAKVALRPWKGVSFKALTGLQRRYWSWDDNIYITGTDLELNIDQWIPAMQASNTSLMLGGSFVNKYDRNEEDIMADPTHKLNLPKSVSAYDVRMNFRKGNFNLLAEYAQKSQDPSFDNSFIYRKGYVAMLSASYSKRGMSALVQAKRSDNMSWRSQRSMNGTSTFINHLPAFTMEHTYRMAAIYPYATQPLGEWAYQAEFGYMFKRNTPLGGKYGTNVRVNFSHVHSLNKNEKLISMDNGNLSLVGSDGYGSSFWKWGDETYYQDLNIQIEKKFSKQFKLNLMYMNQFYNMTVLEGFGGMVHSDIFVAEGKYQFNKKYTLRGEAQYLRTKDHEGDWLFGLLELSIMPHWMITVSDEYNSGSSHLHYYMGSVTFNTGSHRLQVGYGRNSAGFNCSGGVCRYVPASKGLSVVYNYNF